MKIAELVNTFAPILKNWGVLGKNATGLAEELAQSIVECTTPHKSKISVLKRTAGLDKGDKPSRNYYVYMRNNVNGDEKAIEELVELGLLASSSGGTDGRLIVYKLTDAGCEALGFSSIDALEAHYADGRSYV